MSVPVRPANGRTRSRGKSISEGLKWVCRASTAWYWRADGQLALKCYAAIPSGAYQ